MDLWSLSVSHSGVSLLNRTAVMNEAIFQSKAATHHRWWYREMLIRYTHTHTHRCENPICQRATGSAAQKNHLSYNTHIHTPACANTL